MTPPRCTRCGADVAAGARFCAVCGAPAPPPSALAFCASCGSQLNPGLRFCPGCGAAVAPAPGGAIGGPPQAAVPIAAGPGAPAPAGYQGTPSKRGPPKVLIGVAAVVIVLLLLVVSGFCEGFREGLQGKRQRPTPAATPAVGGQAAPPTPAGSTATAAGVTVSRPAGWAALEQGDKGLILAARPEDLTAEAPQGPRLRLELVSGALPEIDALLKSAIPAGTTASAVAASITLAEDPKEVRIGTASGVSIGLREERGGRALMTRYVIVNLGGGRVYQFLLEAPADQWNQHVSGSEGILQSAGFAS